MKTTTQEFTKKKDCKHSVVFEPVGTTTDKPAFCGSVYINRTAISPGTTKIKLTLSLSEGGQDEGYNKL